MNINKRKLNLNILSIVIGGSLLLYDLTLQQTNVYVSTLGVVLLMLGIYKSTQRKVDDNPEDKSS